MGAAGAGLALMGGTSLLQFGLQRSASEIQSAEAETSAQGEELSAKQREVDRKSRLASALASQNAQAGAKGIAAFEGSPLTILEADIKSEEEATQRDVFQSKLRAEAIRSGAKVKEKYMKLGAGVGLLSDVGKTAFRSKGLTG
jgi:hypothetical protein